MPYLTRARLDELIHAAHKSGAEQTRTELQEALDEHLRTIGHRNAELCADNADLQRRLDAKTRECENASQRLKEMIDQIRRPDTVVDLADVTCDDHAELAREINAVRQARGAR